MAKQTIYYITSDNGDGSASVHFFRDGEKAEKLTHTCEMFNMNDCGASSFEIDGDILTKDFFSDDEDFSPWEEEST